MQETRQKQRIRLKELQRLKQIIQDISIVSSAWSIQNITVELDDFEDFRDVLYSEFEGTDVSPGRLVDDYISFDIEDIGQFSIDELVDRMNKINGNTQSIRALITTMGITLGNRFIEVVLRFQGNHKPPTLLKTSHGSKFYEILNYIRLVWYTEYTKKTQKPYSIFPKNELREVKN